MSGKLLRTDSVCPDPKVLLLKHVRENNVIEIGKLLEQHPTLATENYGHPYNKPILYIACKDLAKSVTSGTIDELVEAGAELHFSDPKWDGKEAIHFATLGQNPSILRCIIKHVGVEEINATTKHSNTALHLLLKEGDAEDPNFLECVRILLDNKIDINKTNNKNIPAVYLAAKIKYIEVLQLLLEREDIDLDTYKSYDMKTARQLIEDLRIEDLTTKHIVSNNNTSTTSEKLFQLLRDGDESGFVTTANSLHVISDETGDKTFLQIAAEKNLIVATKYLLEKQMDPNEIKTKNPQTPLFIAAANGHHVILKQLLAHPSIQIQKNVLPEILRKLDYDSDYTTCFEALMDSNKDIDVNSRDTNGNYPLHYAARYGGPDVALQLLNRKASLANRNNFGFLTIADVDYETLKEHLDGCIEAKPFNKLDKENMTICFNYETLLPTQELIDEDLEKLVNKRRITPETDAVLYMSKSSELKPLLKHPVITSFLYMKWHRIRWIFYANLIFYLTFCLSLLLYATVYNSSDNYRGFFYVLLILTTLLLIIRELFQVIVAPMKYFGNFENYIEISLIITVCCMLFIDNPGDGTKIQLIAIVFLLAAFELLFFLGNYPALSTNIVMLRTVSRNFFKFLLFYSIPIVAFAFCFFTLFNHAKVATGDEEDSFVNPFIALFKTIIMLTGEFEAGEIEFDRFPVTSRLIFLTFVITVAVILLNLLNGLAVSDTQEIKNEAELVGHVARAEYVAYAEDMLFSNFIPRRLFSIFCCCPRTKRIASKEIAAMVCLYPQYLTNYELVVYPNQNGRVLFQNEAGLVKEESCRCSVVCMDGKTMRKARLLIQQKKEEEKREMAQNEFKVMILQKLSDIQETLNNYSQSR